VPTTTAAGVFQVITGVVLAVTFSVTLAVAVVLSVVSVGVNVTFNVTFPAVDSIVPAAGEYTKVPGTLAVASSCVAPRAVPTTTAAGVFQVITGVVLADAVTVNVTLAVAVV